MSRRSLSPKVLSVGNRHDYPPECWGELDWKREAAARREAAQVPPVAVPALSIPPGFGGLYEGGSDRKRVHASSSVT
jgi:hypothetical protein